MLDHPVERSRPGLVVGLAFQGHPVVPEWAISLASINYPLNMTTTFSCIKGEEIGVARQKIAEHALSLGAKFLFFIDDDTAVPYFGLRRLVNALNQSDPKVMVAGGIYCDKIDPTAPIVYKEDGQGPFWRWKRGDIFEVAGIGTGCMLIRTEVFQHLEKPWFKTVDEPIEDAEISKYQWTDDLWFCRKVRDAGFKIIADGGVLCVHWDINTGKPYMLPEDSYPLTPREQEPQEVGSK